MEPRCFYLLGGVFKRNFQFTPQKIGEGNGGGTLYILNCSDANGWWITGYTAQSLLKICITFCRPYFVNTIMVQNTNQLDQILNGTPIANRDGSKRGRYQYFWRSCPYATSSYALNTLVTTSSVLVTLLGKKSVLQLDLGQYCWLSILLCFNTGYFSGANDQNAWGIYGMKMISVRGIKAFLRGIDGQTYTR